MVLGMGVDYGVFVVDSASDPEEMGTTMLSTFLGSLTTVFTFGVLALSQHPALRALGVTIGVGILLSFLLAPLSLLLLRAAGSRAWLVPGVVLLCLSLLLPALGCASLGLGLARALPDLAAECPGRLLPTEEMEGDFLVRQRARVQGEDLDWRLELVAQKRGEELVLIGLDAFGAKLFVVTQRGSESRWSGRAVSLPTDLVTISSGRFPGRWTRPQPGVTIARAASGGDDRARAVRLPHAPDSPRAVSSGRLAGRGDEGGRQIAGARAPLEGLLPELGEPRLGAPRRDLRGLESQPGDTELLAHPLVRVPHEVDQHHAAAGFTARAISRTASAGEGR
jgi:hypothetical protein